MRSALILQYPADILSTDTRAMKRVLIHTGTLVAGGLGG
jgi:hypothetical protein